MKTKTILTVAALTSVLLAGCSGDRYEVNDENCSDFAQFPDNQKRDALVETCMTRGKYHMPEPQTF